MKFLFLANLALLAIGGNSLQIISIKEWSGSKSQRTEVLSNPVPLVVIQHTVTSNCLTDEECLNLLKSLRNNFLNKGFSDIAYNFLIGGNGKVYEGAGWNLVGAHTKGYNTKSIGIGFIGDFRENTPAPEALQAAQDLLSFGKEHKHLSEDYKLVGHRQVSNTLSPGEGLQNIIEGWPHWANV